MGFLNLFLYIISLEPNSKTLVFVETKRGCDNLYYFLKSRKILCEVIHGDCTQRQRQSALERFKSGRLPVLIATSVSRSVVQA